MRNALVSVLFFALSGTAYAADIVPVEDPLVVNADQLTPAAPAAERWAGPYVGVAIGHGFLKDSLPAEGDDTIYGAFAGYNLQWGPIVFGAEIGGEKTDIMFTDGSTIAAKHMYGARLRGGLANEWAFAYGSIGVQHGVTNEVAFLGLVSPKNEDTALQFGAGIDFAVTNNLALGVDFTYAKYEKFGNFSFLGNTVDVETKKLQLRLSYRFN
jgi:outer membrane immunogenic protein